VAKILIVDDELEFAEMVALRLRRTGGYEVAVAGDGAAGLLAARENKPDVILLDLMMPKLDGYQVLEQLKKSELTGSLPVIMLTASASPKTLEKLLQLGAADYVIKPFEPPDLMAKVKAALEQKNV
jgi:DNA-binding response OmpR family regulator